MRLLVHPCSTRRRCCDSRLVGHLGFAPNHPALDLDSATHGVNHTRKFRQQSVAGVLYDAAAMFGDLRFEQLA